MPWGEPMNVASYFDAMSYGPAPEGDGEARAWLARHEAGFGHFIGGAFRPSASGESFETFEPARAKLLARLAKGGAADVDAAVAAARAAQGPWAALPGHARARHLYALARLIQDEGQRLRQNSPFVGVLPAEVEHDIKARLAHGQNAA